MIIDAVESKTTRTIAEATSNRELGKKKGGAAGELRHHYHAAVCAGDASNRFSWKRPNQVLRARNVAVNWKGLRFCDALAYLFSVSNKKPAHCLDQNPYLHNITLDEINDLKATASDKPNKDDDFDMSEFCSLVAHEGFK
jgi:hypothetical protein